MTSNGNLDACQRGTTLVEALVALLVLAFGIAAVARLHTDLRRHADIARQRSEAVRLAQEDIESMRTFAIGAASAGVRAWADIDSAVRTVDASSGLALDTQYRIARVIGPDAAGSATQASVVVTWDDRRGESQHIVLDAIIAGQDPTHAAALALAPAGRPVRGALARAARIPLTARNLGDGRSAYKPVAGGGIVLLFDNVSGRVLGRCTGIATAQAGITTSDLATCDAVAGQLLSGIVRFALDRPPDPTHAHDATLDFSIALALTGGTYAHAPTCSSEARKTVQVTDADGTHAVAVASSAVPDDVGLAAWTDTGDRYVAYACIVYPRADGAWSGRATLVPLGWSIGSGAADRRVCRYAADLDGSGSVDSNDEHPAAYADVRGALPRQNYLVITGDQACPAGSAVHVAGTAADIGADASTAPHQP